MSFLTLLSGSSGVVPVTPGPAWTLTVGGMDLTSYVHNGARFVEIASSTDGQCAFTLNGNHAAVSVGASILLNVNGQAAWEGTVSDVTIQTDTENNPVGMMVLGAPLSAQLDTSINYVSSQATDVSTLAGALCAQTPVPFGSQTNIGTTGGTLSIKNVASGLSVAGLLTRKHWRVQNGAVSFVGPDTMTSISQPLNGASVSGSSVVVTGGLDAITKQPLQGTFATSGSGPAYQAAHPELADHDTLTTAGAALADRYGESATTTTLTLPTQTNLRAGDWFVDDNGTTAHAHRVEYALTAGKFVPTVDFGFPALPVASADTQSARTAQHPASSVAHDFLVAGAAFSNSGLSVTIGVTTFVLAGAQSQLNAATLTLNANSTSLISATAAGFVASEYAGLPAPGSALPLYVVTTDASGVVGYENVAPHGGIGSYHLKPANPNNAPSVSVGSITLVAEGATQAKATVPFTITGLSLDDTIGSIEIVQSFAGLNQWGNSHVLAWSPAVTSFTDERHGLSAGQGYDLGVNILGRDGKPLNANPLIIGTSPTISAAAIAIALNLDQVADGTTYARIKSTELQGGSGGAGTVYRLNDGVIIRTAGHIGEIIGLDGSGNPVVNLSPSGGIAGQIGSGAIAGGSVTNTHIASQAVTGTQLIPTVYSTQQPNSLDNMSKWSTISGTYIDNATPIADGAIYYWDTGAGSYAGNLNAYQQPLLMGAASSGPISATFILRHSAFLSGGVGLPRIFFTGTTAGSTSTTQQSTSVSGTSTCSVGGTGTYDPNTDAYVYPYHWTFTNGAKYTQTVSPNVAVDGTHPLALNLNSVNCPTAADGSSSLTVELTDSSGTLLQRWTGIVTPQTLSYSTSHSADTFRWSIWSVPVNGDNVNDVPYSENMACTFSGNATYYQTSSSSGQTYVLSSDGSQQRISTSDSNVQFTQLTADTIAIKVYNSATTSTAFSIGLDVSGV
jgi:hypothetical protein